MTDIPVPQEARKNRLVFVDALRGVAIVLMVWFHLNWDLRYFQFTQTPIDTDFWWRALQHLIVGLFMLLTGASLVLAHGRGIRWRPFWRRFAQIAGAALAISLVTWFVFPDAFIYFGVLHAIALFSLMGLLFLRLPAFVTFLAGAAIVVPAIFFQDPVFNSKLLSAVGFWTVPPLTEDLVPVFPWFGITLIGQAGMRALLAATGRARLARFGGRGKTARVLAFLGRWSLIIYLVHQLILFGILTPLAALVHPENAGRAERFAVSCHQSCRIGDGTEKFCRSYCACALEQVAKNDLWATVDADPMPADGAKQIAQISQLCTAMARDTGEAATGGGSRTGGDGTAGP